MFRLDVYSLGLFRRRVAARPQLIIHHRRKPLLPLLAFAASGAALLCSASVPGTSWAQGWKTEWNKVLAAARKEGEVRVYCTPSAGHRKGLSAFRKSYPEIKLSLVPMRVPQLEARVRRERQAGIYGFDVYVAGISSTVFTRQIPAGWYDPLKPAIILPDVLDDKNWRVGPVGPGVTGFDAGFLDKERKYAYAFSWNISNNVFINYAKIPEGSIKTLRDFLKPELRGKFIWLDPRMRQAGSNVLASMMQTLSDADVKTLLVDQKPVISRDGRQVAEWVAQGRYPIGIGVVASNIAQFQKIKGVGDKIRSFKITSASPATGGLLLFNRAPHPNAAKVFVNWLLSRKGQDAWAKAGSRVSRRADVPSYDPDPTSVPDPNTKYFSGNVWQTAQARGRAMKLADKLLGK